MKLCKCDYVLYSHLQPHQLGEVKGIEVSGATGHSPGNFGDSPVSLDRDRDLTRWWASWGADSPFMPRLKVGVRWYT